MFSITTRNVAYWQRIMSGAITPDKFARSHTRENSWQSYQGQPPAKVL